MGSYFMEMIIIGVGMGKELFSYMPLHFTST